MADEDEIDVLGDFNLESLLNKDESRLTSCYDGGVSSDYCDYPPSWYLDVGSPPWYDRSQLDTFSPLPFSSIPLSSSPGSLQWNESNAGSSSSTTGTSAANWTEKERSLLEEGLELFGRSWSRLAQFVGTKTSHQIKSYLKLTRPCSESETQSVSISSGDGTFIVSPGTNDANVSYTEIIDDMQIPASMEEVIAVVSTAQPTVPSSHHVHMMRNGDSSSSVPKRKKNKAMSMKMKSKRGRPPRSTPQKVPARRGRGRPRKLQEHITIEHTTADSAGINVISELTETPRLGEEVIRIKREGCHSSDDSDIEIDIEDDEEHKCERIAIKIEIPEEDDARKLIPDDPCSTLTEESSNKNQEFTVKMETGEDETDCVNAGKECKPFMSHQDILDRIHRIPPPLHERILKPDEITEEERAIHVEFFEGRPAKTQKRYLKIRNHIIDSWLQNRPTYVTKTSVRTGLRNCGDVNCIGRIHSYLEQTGAINFGCDQTRYYHELAPSAGPTNSGKEKHNRELLCMEGIRPRKKKQEIDEDLLGSVEGGYTIQHSADGQTTLTYNTTVKVKSSKMDHSIKLLHCAKFSSDKPAPFTVQLYLDALLVVDVHSHCSYDTEVIGLLGGELRQDTLHIVRAVACQSSLSNSTHCDMCPVSQSEASEALSREGLSVVGWYHSHPTFLPNPSLQDMSTQSDMQRWFSDTSAAPFVGLILSPYLANSTSIASQYRVLIVDPEGDSGGTPYRFPVDIVVEDLDVDELLCHISTTVSSMDHPNLDGPLFAHDLALPPVSRLQKCLESARVHIETSRPQLSSEDKMRLLKGIRDICKSHCSS